jgi:hypothetical protein
MRKRQAFLEEQERRAYQAPNENIEGGVTATSAKRQSLDKKAARKSRV